MTYNNKDGWTKKEFQEFWGAGGYVDEFDYGVGIEQVSAVCLYPFVFGEVLEIGSGGGSFTHRINSHREYGHTLPTHFLTAIDVIKKPALFKKLKLKYIELPDKDYSCKGVKSNSIDFAFSYGVFCHLPNEALKQYLKSVRRVLKKGGDFIFMLSDFNGVKHLIKTRRVYTLGELLPDVGHYYQDERTLDLIIGEGWDIITRDFIPNHRDIIIHLKRKK